jgi:hypothetical protein
MRTYTNLAWPDDPYRASQQLYRRPSPMLAAFVVIPVGRCPITVPAAVATAYLPLHRTRAVTVTSDTVTFGVRAVSTSDPRDLPRLAEIADLDLIQARRHAKYLAGHALSPDLRALREAALALTVRGLAAVESAWGDRPTHVRGTTAMIDVGGGRHDLADTCHRAALITRPDAMAEGRISGGSAVVERLAAAAAEQALAIALTCARELGRYRWQVTLCTAPIMAAATWDLFPAGDMGRFTVRPALLLTGHHDRLEQR